MHRGISVAIAVAGLAIGTATVSASTPGAGQTISGSFLELGPDNFTKIQTSPAGEFVTVDIHPIDFTSGSLIGTSVSTEHTASHPDGSFETHNTVVFTGTLTTDQGTVLGTGTLTINFNATGVFTDAVQTFTAHFQIVGGTGDFAGIRGEGVSTGVPGSSTGGHGVYSGTLS